MKSDEETWKGILYAVMILIIAMIQTVLFQQHWYLAALTSMKTRTALFAEIYRKSLKMSVTSRKEKTIGEIVNLMAVDVQTFQQVPGEAHYLLLAPLEIVISVYFLWGILGPSVLAGLSVMLVMIPINALIVKKLEDLQMRQMKTKDRRVKMVNEILNGIKVLKLYAWEKSFEDQVQNVRKEEIDLLRFSAFLNAVNIFLWTCSPFLVSNS